VIIGPVIPADDGAMVARRTLLCLLVLTTTIANGAPAAFAAGIAEKDSGVYALFAVTPGFDTGRGEHVAGTDYHITGDHLDRLTIGDRLWVERVRQLRSPASKVAATLLIPVATVRVIRVDTGTAVARLERLLPRQQHPHTTYATPMVGDRLVPVPPTGLDTAVVLPSDVLFDFDRVEIRADARSALDTLAKELTGCSQGPIEVHGHTDALGPPAYNDKLSERRARAVANYLADAAHLPRNRFRIVGHGERQPVADNTTAAGRQQNRRVAVCLPFPTMLSTPRVAHH
jgi:outer membrane protein OmpA-like peptidoglycan-associated protein